MDKEIKLCQTLPKNSKIRFSFSNKSNELKGPRIPEQNYEWYLGWTGQKEREAK